MKILVVKISSMGDIIHTLPAITDAARFIPNLQVDWLVEESFQEIPQWHSVVSRVIPVALRRFRKQKFNLKAYKDFFRTIRLIRQEKYDAVIDAQGLVKSAFLTTFGRGKKIGLDWQSARESFASLFYGKKITVNFKQHAVIRARELFAKALDYPVPTTVADYGLSVDKFERPFAEKYFVFLHGTTWATKLWPEIYWRRLAEMVTEKNYSVKLLWGNAEEKLRAERLASGLDKVEVLPRSTLKEIAGILAGAQGAVAVDTGFAHLAAAFALPTVSIYGATDPVLTGCHGANQQLLRAEFPCAPCLQKVCSYTAESSVHPACYGTLPPEKIRDELLKNCG